MAEPPDSRKAGVSDEPVSPMRVSLYKRLLEAEEQIAHVLYRRGVKNDVVQEALDAIDERMTEAEERDDLYLSALKHYVEALGGRLEVRALFGEDAIVIRREPDR